MTRHNGCAAILGCIVLCALVAGTDAGAAIEMEHASARIASLGGTSVSGIIPDLATDMTVNPAYAFFAGRLTARYARHRYPGYAPTLPNLYGGGESTMYTNELSVWGFGLFSWRSAAFVQWAMSRPESESSDPSFTIDSRSSIARDNASWNRETDDFARIDLIAARALGDRYTLGLRLRGWGYNDTSSELDTYGYERYLDPLFGILDYTDNETRIRSLLGRRLSFDFQAGIVKSDGAGPRTDLALAVSLDRLEHRYERYELDIQKEYDAIGALDEYYYSRYHWNDARDGDMWRLSSVLGHSFGNGVRAIAGGEVATCSYDTEWDTSDETVQWGYGSADQKVTGSFDGDGSLLRWRCYAKGGRIFSLHRTADLYVGLHGVFERTRAKEEPLIHYALESAGEGSGILLDRRSTLETEESIFDLRIPLSVEFRPASCFTYFTSFILTGRWRKEITTRPLLSLFNYYPPTGDSVAARRAGAASPADFDPNAESTDWSRQLFTGSTVALGFSFHYRDRFFVDAYTANEIVPNSVTNVAFDVRYAF